MSGNHFPGLAKMVREASLSDGAEVLLYLLIDRAMPGDALGEADLERWRELTRTAPKAVWTSSFEAAEELGAKGFIRGFYGKAGKGVLRATFTDALIEAAKARG